MEPRRCVLLLLAVCAHGIRLDDPDLADIFAKRHLRQLDIKELSSESFHCPKSFGQFSHADDCRKFIECIYSIPQVHDCPLSTAYSSSEKRCVESDTCISEQGSTDEQQAVLATVPPSVKVWECPEEFSAFPVPGDCTRFVMCMYFQPFDLQCPENLTFDMEQRQCIEYPQTENSSCQHKPTRMMPEISELIHTDFRCLSPNGKFADFQDCSIYYECVSGVSHLRACKSGKHFDHLLHKCMSADKAKCLFKCRQQNGIYPYLSDCHKYVQCLNGQPKVKECPNGEAFDLHELRCVDNESIECNTQIEQTEQVKSKAKSKDSGFTCPEEFGDFPDVMRCSIFWQCKDGEAKYKACPWGFLFNPETRKCDHPSNVTCPPYKTGKKVICYFDVDGKRQMQPENLDPFLCTHIHYKHAVLDSTTLYAKTGNLTKDIDQHFLLCLRRLKKLNPHLKIILSLGGWQDNSTGERYEMLGAIERWNNITAYAFGLQHQYGFDGLELDWEFPFCRTPRCSHRPSYTKLGKDAFSAFVEVRHLKSNPMHEVSKYYYGAKHYNCKNSIHQILDLRSKPQPQVNSRINTEQIFSMLIRGIKLYFNARIGELNRAQASTHETLHVLSKATSPPLLLSLKASGDATIINAAYDVPVISRYFDYITVMAYLSSGAPQYYAEHPARFHHNPEDVRKIDDAESIMNLWEMMGAPKDKLVMGIRADGRQYLLADARNNDINSPISVPPYPSDIDYSLICKKIKSQEWSLVRDKYAGPYMYKDRTWIGYQDPKAVHQKAKYAFRNGYSGVALIGAISDDFNATCCRVRNPLLKAAVYAFSRKGQDLSKFGCPHR